MAETEIQPDSDSSPPQFELDYSDEYSRFLLHSQSEILAVLRVLISKGAMITVHFDEGRSFLLSSMIALSADNREFILDIGGDAEMNQRALLAKRLIFTTKIDKVKVQFSLNKLSPTQSEGRAAFLGSVPETLLRLQRREFFRLSTPIIMGALAGLWAERSGVPNIAIEGMMLAGACLGFVIYSLLVARGVDIGMAQFIGVISAVISGAGSPTSTVRVSRPSSSIVVRAAMH